MAFGSQDQGDRGSRSERAFTLQERLSLPTRLKGDGGSVRASLARKLVHTKLFGRGSGGTASGSVGGGSAARNGGVGSISVRASQRVVVKAFVARHKGPRAVANPGKAIVQHVKYLAREGVGFDGSEAHFYGPAGELAPETVKEATRAWGDDRHHFRLIISPEQADKMEDLQGYIRDVMGDVSRDLKEPALTWVAVNHHDTDQPHAHVLIRGIRANGSTLVIPREMISQGIRQRAESHAQSLLGDKTRTEAERQLFGRTRANYWTDIDQKLTKLAEANGGLLAPGELTRTDTFGAVARGRINHLERMGLVTRSKAGIAFAPDMKQRLDTLQRSKDEIRRYWDQERSRAFGERMQGRRAAEVEAVVEAKIERAIKPHMKVQPVKTYEVSQDRKVMPPHGPAPDQSVKLDQKVELQQAHKALPELDQSQLSRSRQAEPHQQRDPMTDRLTPADHILARRSVQTGLIQSFDRDTEAHIAARAAHLIRTGQGKAIGPGIAFTAETWGKLWDNEIKAAARDQLGLNRTDIPSQLSASEGKVLGHIDTSLGRHAIIDRGVNIVAVREVPGAELALGQVLGASLER